MAALRIAGGKRQPSLSHYAGHFLTCLVMFLPARSSVSRAARGRSGRRPPALSARELEELCRSNPELTTSSINLDTLALLSEVCPPTEAKALAIRQPLLLAVPLRTWLEFLSGYGFNRAQFRHILTQASETFLKATIMTASQTMLTCQQLQLAPQGVVQLITCYPQLLYLDAASIKSMLRMLDQYQPPNDTMQ